MNTDPVMEDLTAPLRALRLLALDFPDLPAPTVRISPLYSARFDLSLHDDLGAFEPWRVALRIARDAVDFHTQSDGETWVLKAFGDFAGATVQLIAYGAARVPERREGRPLMARQPRDDLYVRYMRAFKESARHTEGCAACQASRDCPEGAPVHERFARLQDAYNARQSKKRR